MAQPIIEKEYKITDGPSKEAIFTEMQLPSNRQQYLEFSSKIKSGNRNLSINMSQKFEVWINSIAKEDGSGESWIIEGSWKLENTTSKRVWIYFSTKRRQGTLRVLK